MKLSDLSNKNIGTFLKRIAKESVKACVVVYLLGYYTGEGLHTLNHKLTQLTT